MNTKACTKCNEVKPLTEFYKSGKESRCKTCFNYYVKLSAYPNPNAERGAKSTVKRRAVQARYREKHRDKIREIQRNYVVNNKAKVLARTRKYQLSKRHATPMWLTKEHHEAIQSVYIEAERLTNLLGIKYEVDHIVPISGKNVSGLHVPWNLQVIPQTDNRRKFNKYQK